MALSRTKTWGALLALTTTAAFASGAAADPQPGVTRSLLRSRSFLVDLKAGDANSVRMVELVVTVDPEHPGVATKAELRVGKPDKVPDQIVTFKVDAGVDQVLASAEVTDLNFDGYKDFWVLRESGAKWGRMEAWVLDGKGGHFVKDAFAREVSQLDNPELDEASKLIVSSSIGPSEPYRTVRKIVGGRTVVVESCAFHNGKGATPEAPNEGTLVVQKLVGGALKTVTQKQVSLSPGENPCAASSP